MNPAALRQLLQVTRAFSDHGAEVPGTARFQRDLRIALGYNPDVCELFAQAKARVLTSTELAALALLQALELAETVSEVETALDSKHPTSKLTREATFTVRLFTDAFIRAAEAELGS